MVRVMRSSISIADPNGGKNIRLKGAFYEQSFTDGRGVREKAEREPNLLETMLNDEFSKLEKSVSKAVTSNETKIKDAIALFTASTEESLKKHREGVKEAMMQHRKDVLKLAGNTGMMLLGMVLFLFTVSGGTLWYLGGMIQANPKKSGYRKKHCRN